MNCDATQTRLVEWLYGELSEQEEARLREHLAECDSCRSEADKLRRSRQLLESAPEAQSHVDVRRVYRHAAERWERSRRGWRRAALAACAAVLVVGAVAFGRLRIESHAGYLVLSWGGPPADAAEEPPAEPVVEEVSAAPDVPPDPWPTLRRHGERLATLDELAQLLVAEVDSADRRRRVDVAGLERKLKEIERQIARQWYVFDRDVKAVYQLAQNRPATDKKGAQP